MGWNERNSPRQFHLNQSSELGRKISAAIHQCQKLLDLDYLYRDSFARLEDNSTCNGQIGDATVYLIADEYFQVSDDSSVGAATVAQRSTILLF